MICITAPNWALAQTSKFNKPKGYMGVVELSAGSSINGWRGAPVSATMINGYRFMPQLAIGLGTGVQVNGEDCVLPVFVHLRSDILDNWISPYVAFNTGWSFALSNDLYSGLMVEPSIGVGFNAGTKSRVTIGVFCAINSVRVGGYDDPYDYSISTLAYRAVNCVMGLKAGISF